MADNLIPGEDFYEENGRMVFTARYHLKRGICCGSGCRHCPYDADGRRRPEHALLVITRIECDDPRPSDIR